MARRNTPRRWASIATAASHSGYSTRAIREHIAAGRIPAYIAPGSRVVRVDLNDVDEWLNEGRIPTAHLGGAS